jgi:thymidine kinase
VLLGEVDEYEPLSRAAYYKALTKEKLQDMDVVSPVDVDANKKKSNV